MGSSEAEVYLRLFSPDDLDTLARVIDAVSSRRASFLELWHDLYTARLGTPAAVSDRLFHEQYMPFLRSAVLCLGAGNTEGFVSHSADLGEQLARAGVSFAVLVAQLNLLKESCLRLLGDLPGGLTPSSLLTVDKLTASCITAAADSYFRRRGAAIGKVTAPEGEGDGVRASAPLPLRAEFHGMVGRSPAMQEVYGKIQRAASSRGPVLIVGETGTGKELIARAIHDCGPRRSGPFIAVNCAALPRELIESELFGYRRGAFSGALADHLGLFRAAAGGTVLLDEITEMGPELQAKLLRVLQESSVRPVGAIREVPVDVRFIASTNRDLAAVLGCGLLRSDLYYRLSVGVIAVPALRDRGDDVVLLVEHCLAMLNQRCADALPGVQGLAGDAVEAVRRYPWPGNVRELFNALERAFTNCSTLHIGVEDLALPPPQLGLLGGSACSAGETYAEGERALIQRSLAAAGGNKARAARQLGISRKKLYARLAKYALPAVLLAQLAELPERMAGQGSAYPRPRSQAARAAARAQAGPACAAAV